MFRMVPFAFSVEKSTPAGKKYTRGACGACDKLQLWVGVAFSQLFRCIIKCGVEVEHQDYHKKKTVEQTKSIEYERWRRGG